MDTKYKLLEFIFVLICYNLFLASHVSPQNHQSSLPSRNFKEPVLAHAVMCEEIKDLTPKNQAVIFSIKIGEVSCFTSFDPVPEKTFIYHKWFHKDELSTQKKLSLQPPRWATYSKIQLREADKGPWRVDITDDKGRILRTLRFTITD
jgi:hypothetical protein